MFLRHWFFYNAIKGFIIVAHTAQEYETFKTWIERIELKKREREGEGLSVEVKRDSGPEHLRTPGSTAYAASVGNCSPWYPVPVSYDGCQRCFSRMPNDARDRGKTRGLSTTCGILENLATAKQAARFAEL